MKYLTKILICMMCVCVAACNVNDKFQEELYEKVFCILGDNDKVFAVVHSLDEEVSTGFLSIYCGGSNPIEENVTIELERDPDILAVYNKKYYDIDETKFAKELDPSKYEISSYTVTMKAGQKDPYVTIPVKIRPAGLSPDSAYMIPLKIKSVSGNYPINETKASVMYRPLIMNKYAEQKKASTYLGRGVRYELKANGVDTAKFGDIVATKTIFPLLKDKSRVTVGTETADISGTLNLAKIEKFSITLTIDQSNYVTITPYKTIEVQQMGTQEDNRYLEDVDGKKYFFLHYKYRTLTTPVTDTKPAVYSQWYIVQEKLRRED